MARPAVAADPSLQVYLLGTVDFEEMLQFQRRLVYEVSGDRWRAMLVLCEHGPLISVGREGSLEHIGFEPHELAAREWPVRWVNRGGGCLLHLPGQLAEQVMRERIFVAARQSTFKPIGQPPVPFPGGGCRRSISEKRQRMHWRRPAG